MALRPTILVVANDDHARRFLEIALHARGYEAAFASDAESALAAVRHATPSLVLVDMTMPDGEGLRILEQFDQEPLVHIPVLSLVGAGRTGADTTEPELATAIRSTLDDRVVVAA
jgi:two-component system KDP operon response regulator KdpE